MITTDTILNEIESAEIRIRSQIKKTALLFSDQLSRRTKAQVFLKLENRQYTGSFKARGALNKILSLNEKERTRGIITASTGNHGLGVARALQITNVKGKIYLPRTSSPVKIAALQALNAPLTFVNGSSLETELQAKAEAKRTGAVWISPYNDPQVIGGQGTIGIELYEQNPDIEILFVTVGGGGMVSGIATYLKSRNPKIRVIGCWPENSPEMYRSILAGKIVEVPKATETLSDGSAGAVEPGAITFPLCRTLIDEHVLVSEQEIANAMRMIYEETGEMVEGSAGVAAAACLRNEVQLRGKQVAVVMCGGNISEDKFRDVIEDAQHVTM